MSLIKIDRDDQRLINKAQGGYRPHKRPAIVLEEEQYVEGLSEVIKREFFPDLVELQEDLHPQHESPEEYSQNASTPEGHGRAPAKHTPRLSASDSARLRQDSSTGVKEALSLSDYQAKYTSEDNADFLALLDKQNLSRREKYAWHYNSNKIYSDNTLRHQKRLEAKAQEDHKAIGWVDDRQGPAGWQTKPKNALMFNAEPVIDDLEQAQNAVGRTLVRHDATRMPIVQDTTRPPRFAEEDESESEEPMVNGYGFLDEPDTPVAQSSDTSPFPAAKSRLAEKPNPFKIAETPLRDRLHDDLLSKARRGSTPRPASVLRKTVATPKFKSSPMLSPAAHRLLAGRASGLRERLKTPLTKGHLK